MNHTKNFYGVVAAIIGLVLLIVLLPFVVVIMGLNRLWMVLFGTTKPIKEEKETTNEETKND